MMDFRTIQRKGIYFTVEYYNEVHARCLKFLHTELNSRDKKIVVTHHLPSPACNVEEFIGSVLNEAFCVDLTELIEQSEIDFWVYGHSHRNKNDFKIKETCMISNQLGYVRYNEHWSFNATKTIDIRD